MRFMKINQRDRVAWSLDVLGLISQGVLVPILQTWILAQVLIWMFPAQQGTWQVSPFAAFLLSFVAVDYLYYWNHRFLHSEKLWIFHRVHHSITKLDVLATSRNSVWTIFFILYLWIQPVFVYLLKDPTWFMAGLFLGYTLDVWRHSNWLWQRENQVVIFLRSFLIDPQDHEWHHSEEKLNINFGANFNLWDRLHGTFYRSDERPSRVGVISEDTFWVQFLTPWRMK
jgi:sterol desaturase/sphingolipid hydroxylase (fatty acid hydroxylase superfamily)